MRFFIQLLILLDLILLASVFFLKDVSMVAMNKEFLILSVLVLTALTIVAFTFIYRGIQGATNADFFRLFGLGIGIKFMGTIAYIMLYHSTLGIQDVNAIIPVALSYTAYNTVIIWASMKLLNARPDESDESSSANLPKGGE